jgi:hypothetical protein
LDIFFNTGQTRPDRGRDYNRGRGRYRNRNRRTKDGVISRLIRAISSTTTTTCMSTGPGWHRHWCRWPKAKRFSTKSEVNQNGRGSQLSLAQMALLGEASCCCATLATSCQCHPRIGHLSRRILAQLHPNDIIPLHDIAPPGAEQYRRWQHEIHRILCGIAALGLQIQPLEQLIERPVMLRDA